VCTIKYPYSLSTHGKLLTLHSFFSKHEKRLLTSWRPTGEELEYEYDAMNYSEHPLNSKSHQHFGAAHLMHYQPAHATTWHDKKHARRAITYE
jgi:hypothetical protein